MCCYISGSLHLDGALVDVETPEIQVVLLPSTPKQLLEKSWTTYIDHSMSLVHFDSEVIRTFSIQISQCPNLECWLSVLLVNMHWFQPIQLLCAAAGGFSRSVFRYEHRAEQKTRTWARARWWTAAAAASSKDEAAAAAAAATRSSSTKRERNWIQVQIWMQRWRSRDEE